MKYVRTMDNDDPRCDFSDLRGGPKVPVLWGPSRAVLNRVLFGLATAVSRAPYWVEVQGQEGTSEELGPADLGWIPPERLFTLGSLLGSGSSGRPEPVAFALISFLRDPSPGAIAEVMKLPPLESGEGGTAGSSRLVAIANVDRVDQLWPQTPQAMREVVRAFLRAGVVPYFSTQKPTKRREAADFVFEAAASSLGSWRTGTLRCEKAPQGAAWKEGDSLAFTRLPTIAAALSGKTAAAVG